MRKRTKPKIRFSGTIENIGKYIYWRYQDLWVGYLEKFPDYFSHGKTIAELEEGFLKIYELIRKGDLKGA